MQIIKQYNKINSSSFLHPNFSVQNHCPYNPLLRIAKRSDTLTIQNGVRRRDNEFMRIQVHIRELKQLRRRPQRRLQKNNTFNDQNKSSARASRFLVHFFDVHCTTTTWNLLIWRFMEDVDRTTNFPFSFWTWVFNSRKSRLHLTYWGGPNGRD